MEADPVEAVRVAGHDGDDAVDGIGNYTVDAIGNYTAFGDLLGAKG
jgi:hypothetical protein